jgi:type IV secretory pathway ATPase VirB11/archaellum biosynthesis ATPase
VEEGELLVTEVRVELVVKEAGKMAPMHLVVTEVSGDQVVRLEAMVERELLTGAQVTTQMEEMEGMAEPIVLQVEAVVVLVFLRVQEGLRHRQEGKVEMVVLVAVAAAVAAVGAALMLGCLLVAVVVVVMQVVAVEA